MPTTRRKASGPASKGAQSTLSFGGNRSKITKPTTTVEAKEAKDTVNKVEPTSRSAVDLSPSEDVVSPISQKLEESDEPNPEAAPAAQPVNLRVPTEDETRARRVKDKEIHSYWQAREDERKTPRGMVISALYPNNPPHSLPQTYLPIHNPLLTHHSPSPVHQQDLSLQEKILRHFDLSSQYGVSPRHSHFASCLHTPTRTSLHPSTNPTPHLQPCIGITRLARWKRASKLGLHPPIEVLAVLLQEADKTKVGSEIKGQTAYIDELLGGRSAIEV